MRVGTGYAPHGVDLRASSVRCRSERLDRRHPACGDPAQRELGAGARPHAQAGPDDRRGVDVSSRGSPGGRLRSVQRTVSVDAPRAFRAGGFLERPAEPSGLTGLREGRNRDRQKSAARGRQRRRQQIQQRAAVRHSLRHRQHRPDVLYGPSTIARLYCQARGGGRSRHAGARTLVCNAALSRAANQGGPGSWHTPVRNDLVSTEDRSLLALPGTSRGASTAVYTSVGVLEKCFAGELPLVMRILPGASG